MKLFGEAPATAPVDKAPAASSGAGGPLRGIAAPGSPVMRASARAPGFGKTRADVERAAAERSAPQAQLATKGRSAISQQMSAAFGRHFGRNAPAGQPSAGQPMSGFLDPKKGSVPRRSLFNLAPQIGAAPPPPGGGAIFGGAKAAAAPHLQDQAEYAKAWNEEVKP